MRSLILGLGLWATAAIALETPLAVARMGKGTTGTRLDFGISRHQADSLYRATGHTVDLRNLVLVSDTEMPFVDWSDAHLVGWLDQVAVPPPGFYATPDPSLAGEWWLQKLELEKAWDKATGKGVTIADCDSGFYTSEPDLVPNLLLNDRYDLADKDQPLVVDDGNFISHGTSVAAILIGSLDGKGTNGIAFNSKLVPLQNFNYSNDDDIGKEEATARCVLRAITLPSVKVIVLENQTAQGSSETFAGTREAVKLALASGVTVVSAGGNYSKELTIEAGEDTGTIIVGAVDTSAKKESFSNYGKRISVAAYGRNLHTLSGPNGSMGSFGGTSGATPQVAATVALMLEVNPKLTPAQIRQILEATRITTPDNQDVGGMLNVVGAVEAAGKTRASAGAAMDAEALRKKVITILSKP